ncbi:sporulation stage V [Thermoclostridium stercorarium subsp. stercorarium DSM 8532]|jgi:stage V sporulation protein AE|uniref:Sporulation stage V n=3 Tax=Thermoclostridium stercorarium TaxID=1510 RepID=L7VRU0_THES1|nr:stage V sporulation protein AE [Thermoclostridium stercorarium]AGC69364.1 sporulation stage V [Thermoclostridium stercorarium subsp. stercorarium DSM 8532]AGI40325.1 sporulation protein 5AE [Thermoclostridium stercorarium subsp. stercorarium DSM 8532]ANW99621.1 stage V sporulation protein AE [Thermoclostridium stercorarium subsp. thermolacticum DSM 2910]ANX02248.1 stage V sporulation protein AE [Thermoclostridium stercorarium subsp. leptospartum DSM 9219]UZQ85324.1 stage V sporulation prote
MEFVRAFLLGGIICVIGQLLIDLTKLTPARIMVIFVVAGVILGMLGIYPMLVEWGGAGATVPIIGFGNVLAKGVIEDVEQKGLIGAFSGGVRAGAVGIAAAVFFGYIMAVVSKPKTKNKA